MSFNRSIAAVKPLREMAIDGSQSLDLQHDDLRAAGVEQDNIYEDRASGSRDDRSGLTACLKSLRAGDVLVVWKLDRLGRSLAHLPWQLSHMRSCGQSFFHGGMVSIVKRLKARRRGVRVDAEKLTSRSRSW